MAQGQGLTGIANRYAVALLPLVQGQSQTANIDAQLRTLSEWTNADKAFHALLHNPSLRRQEQSRAIAAILDKAQAHDIVRGFLQLLCRNRRLFLLSRIIERYFSLRTQAEGVLVVHVQSATPLEEAQKQVLTSMLAKACGKTPQLQVTVVPELLGGLVVRFGSKMIDVSLRHKLTQLQTQMKEAM